MWNNNKGGGTGRPHDRNQNTRKQRTQPDKDVEQDEEWMGRETRNTYNQKRREGQLKQDTHLGKTGGTKTNNHITEGEEGIPR